MLAWRFRACCIDVYNCIFHCESGREGEVGVGGDGAATHARGGGGLTSPRTTSRAHPANPMGGRGQLHCGNCVAQHDGYLGTEAPRQNSRVSADAPLEQCQIRPLLASGSPEFALGAVCLCWNVPPRSTTRRDGQTQSVSSACQFPTIALASCGGGVRDQQRNIRSLIRTALALEVLAPRWLECGGEAGEGLGIWSPKIRTRV